MSEWKEYRLSDVIDLISGGTPKTSVPEYWNGDIPWLSVSDFNNGRKYVYKAEKNITNFGLEKSSTNILKEGQIIISARGTVGVISMLGKDMAFNQSNYGIDAKEDISENHFLYYLLINIVPVFLSNSYGAVFNTITKTTFDHIKVKLPPLPEQKAIAEVLSSLDDKIYLLHRQNKTLEQMAETLFRQWFVEEAKEDWVDGVLGDFGEIITGKTPSKNFPDYWGDKFHFITPTDFKSFGMFTNQPQRSLSKLGWGKMKSLQLSERSILVTCIGSDMGKVTISSKPCITNQQLNSIILKNNKYLGFVFEFIKSQYQLLRNIAFGGTTMPIINKSDFSNISIPIPPERKIEEYQTIWETFSNKIFKNQVQISNLEKMRDTLLPKLISGEVKVQ